MAKRRRIGLPLSGLLMVLALVGIAGFQAYWMRKVYTEELAELRKETDISFRDVVYKLQMQHFRGDSLFIKHHLPPNLFLFNMLDSLRTQYVDSADPHLPAAAKRNVTISIQEFDTPDSRGPIVRERITANRMEADAPLSVAQIDSAYRIELARSHITVPFRIERIQMAAAQDSGEVLKGEGKLKTNFLYVGLSKSYAYQALFDNPARYLLRRMVWPIVAGVLLLGFTALAFVVLYGNLRQQQRLAQYKNDFISNMTHELKTPISTIQVAVEALRHFDALGDPKRTKDYLDISAFELHRLSLLVDKVLRLSQFENREVEFHFSVFDLREVAAEVMAAMRLSIEKAGAVVNLIEGPDGAVRVGHGAPGKVGDKGVARFEVRGDRSHISGVISNLMDNALKYAAGNPVITMRIWREGSMVLLAVTDNGIGIPAAYQGRIFDKFFRVPSGDHHNIKGYGLGLNYANEVIHIHRGSIAVESKEGSGSTFTVQLPGYEQN